MRATAARWRCWNARKAQTAGERLANRGNYREARPLYERALQLAESVRPGDDPYVAILLTDVAAAAVNLDNAVADASYSRALAMLERTRGPRDAWTAWIRSRLGAFRQRTGRLVEAERLMQTSLTDLEAAVGQKHRWYVRALSTFGILKIDLLDYEGAANAFSRAVALLDAMQQSNTALYAGFLNNLGEAYRQQNRLEQAEAAYQRALTLGEQLNGKDSFETALPIQNLGIIAREKRDYEMAERYDLRAIAIKERVLGPEHPDVLLVVNNLANVYRALGRTEEALALYHRTLRVWERLNGPYHRNTLTAVGNIARTYAAAGDIPHALEYQRRADAIVERQIALNLAVGTEAQKLTFVRRAAERTDRTISLHLLQAPENAEAASLAAQVLIQRKGRVLDATTDAFAAARQSASSAADPVLLDRLDQWKTTNAQLARIALSGGDESTNEPLAQRIAALQTQLDGLEAEISLRSAAFRAVWAPVTLEAVQAALPDDTVLIEFVVFGAFNIRAESSTEDLGPAHYAAYVIHKHGAPHGTDLGPVAAINPLIAEWRDALRDPTRRDLKPRTQAITDRLWRPLRAEIGDVARVLISPDGDLNLVPFEALLDQDGRYVIERHAISYLTSGRDLLHLQHPASPGSPATAPVIVAAPFFGEPPAAPPNATRSSGSASRRDGAATTRDFSSLYFAPLPATETEGRAIKALFPESTLLLGREATETAVHALAAPRILHIASHGFFVEESAPAVKIDNPLLRSGIALAGANLRGERGDDGVLTALEASGLNLWGTKLVTLSACDTGIGEIRNGEGVYGLRRAFVLAGAESLVMTLWPVSDLVARETMTAYYRGLHNGLGRGDALRQAKLTLLRRQGRQHPFFWASFIQSGQWGALD